MMMAMPSSRAEKILSVLLDKDGVSEEGMMPVDLETYGRKQWVAAYIPCKLGDGV